MNQIVLATNNKHKVKEIKAILKGRGLKVRVLTLDDFPKMKPVVENKSTIKGNAIKKAKEVAKRTNCVALADDTGLFISALNGKPGVYSARYAGPNCNFMDNCKKVLRVMKKIPTPKRRAEFRTVAALADPKGKVVTSEGSVVGQIVSVMEGTKGFGYDPIFYVPSQKKTFAQMPVSLKNKLSHRARAFKRIPRLLNLFLKSI